MTRRDVAVNITSPSSTDSRDDGYVRLRVEDKASGECLADVEIPAGRWWRLCQGGQQTWPALMSPHLDRVGKELETTRVPVPAPVEGETRRDQEREVWRALAELKPDWLDFQDFDIRRTNRGYEAVVRRWKEPETRG